MKRITRHISGVLVLSFFCQNVLLAAPDPLSFNPSLIPNPSYNHYIVITALTPDSVTYTDPGIGQDHHNESVTVTFFAPQFFAAVSRSRYQQQSTTNLL